MAFAADFRLYRDDPQERAIEPIDELFPELVAELDKRRSLYPGMVGKGRITASEADHELRVWASIHDHFALCDDKPKRTGAVASWTEQVHCLRREIALRRRLYPRLIEGKRLDAATADRKLLLVESVHHLLWAWTWHDEAVTARADTARRLAA